jgi:hypothetical protein
MPPIRGRGVAAAGVQRQMNVIFSAEQEANYIPKIYRKQEERPAFEVGPRG